MPKGKRDESVRRKRGTAVRQARRAMPVTIEQTDVDALRAGDRKIQRELTKHLETKVPSKRPSDAKKARDGKSAPIAITADIIRKIAKTRALPKAIVESLNQEPVSDPPRKHSKPRHQAPTVKPPLGGTAQS